MRQGVKTIWRNPLASKVYLLHYLGEIGDLTKPTGHAQHYLGSTSRSLKQRLAEHAAGQGAKITAAFARQNIDFICVRTWNGGRRVERYLKRRHAHARLCPLCNPNARKYGNQMGGTPLISSFKHGSRSTSSAS